MVPYKIMLSVLFNFKMRKLLPDDFDHLLDSVDLFLHHKIVPTMQFLNMKKNHLNIGSLRRLFQLIEIDWLIPFFRYITTIIDPIWPLTFLLHPIEPLHPLTDQEVVVSGGLHVAQVAVGGGGGEHPLERTLTTVLVYTLRQHPDVIRRQDVQDGL